MDETHDALFISSDGFILIKTIPKHFSTYRLARRVDHYGDSFPSAEVIAPAAQTTTYYKTIRDVCYGDVNMPVFSETGAVHDRQPLMLKLFLAMAMRNEYIDSELDRCRKDITLLEAHNDALKGRLRQFESRNLEEQGYVSEEDHQSIVDDYDSTTNDLISANRKLTSMNRELRKQLAGHEAKEIKEAVEELKEFKDFKKKNSREKGPSAVSKAKEHTFQRGPIIYCQGDYLDD